MMNQKTPKDLLMEVVNSMCDVTRNNFEDYNMSIDEIQIKLRMLQSVRRYVANFLEHKFAQNHQSNIDGCLCEENLETFKSYINEVLSILNSPNEGNLDEQKMFGELHNYLVVTFRQKVKDLLF